MVSTTASVPIRVLICYDLNVVSYNPLQSITMVVSLRGDRHITYLTILNVLKGMKNTGASSGWLALKGLLSLSISSMDCPEGAFIPFYGVYVV